MKLFNIITIFMAIAISVVTCEEITLTAGPLTCEYKKKDLNEEHDTATDVTVDCIDSSCTVNGTGATATDGLLSITAAGTYIIQGSLNGQIRIEVTKDDFVHLVLNSVTITSKDGPAIYGVNADKITITLLGDNTLTDTNHYSNVVDEEPDACLFIDSDLSINGSGALTVTGNYGDAIRCKKDLKIVSGNITVPSTLQRGIKAKNSICVKDGTVDVNSTNTAIKVTRDNDAEKGYIVIDGGSIAVSTEKDAIHAETHLTINGGYIDVKKSMEGIEGQMIDILGGEVHVAATDDGINASKISSTENEGNDDGHGEGTVPNSNEDGTNNNRKMGGGAGGGKPGNGGHPEANGTDGSVYINIVGGKVYVTVSGNDVDGIDSNGVLYIGGEAEVYTSISGGDIYGNMAALDAEGTNAIANGATVIVTAGNKGGNMGHGKMGNGQPMNGDDDMGQSNMGNRPMNGQPPNPDGMNNNNPNREQANSGNNEKTKRQDRPTDRNEGMNGNNNGGNGNNNNNNNGGNMNGNGNNNGGNMNDNGNGGMNHGMGGPYNDTMHDGMNHGMGGPNNGNMNGGGGPMGGMGGMGGMGETGVIQQPYLQTSVDTQNEGTPITVKDKDQKVIATYTPNVSYSTVLVTSPSIKAGETYTIVAGETSVEVVASEANGSTIQPPSVTSPTGNVSTSGSTKIQPKVMTVITLLFSLVLLF